MEDRQKMKFIHISVNCFPGANTSGMKHYTELPIKKNPNAEVVIIRTGTNDLSSDSTPTEIATNMIDLAVDVKKNLTNHGALWFPQSFQEVTNYNRKHSMFKELKELCASRNIRYIEHGNVHPRNHLNWSKLYFNFHDNTLFLNNICKYLECWQVFDCCNEKEGNVNGKTNNSNEKKQSCLL